MNFVAIDVETANSKRAICQIGIAKFSNGILVDEWVSYINPEAEFEPMCIYKHKIREQDVINEPKFYEVFDKLCYFMEGAVCVYHSGSGFDKDAIEKAFKKYNLQLNIVNWIDTCNIAKNIWPEYDNHKLSTLCEKIGFQFKHHHALEDAKACAQILLEAIKESNLHFDDLIEKTYQPNLKKKSQQSEKIISKGALGSALNGEVVLFTGTLPSMSEDTAKNLAVNYGADLAPGISKKVTLLIAGSQDPKKLKGKPNSNSYLTAEKYITEGHKIRILNESEFLALINKS